MRRDTIDIHEDGVVMSSHMVTLSIFNYQLRTRSFKLTLLVNLLSFKMPLISKAISFNLQKPTAWLPSVTLAKQSTT